MHAVTLARSLDIASILVPPAAGVFSALGLLFPATEHHYVRTLMREIEVLQAADVTAAYGALEAEGRRELESEGYGGDGIEFERFADMRYRGENTELTVPVGEGDDDLAAAVVSFGDEHERTYGYQSDDEVVVLVNLRLIARGRGTEARVPASLSVSAQAGGAVTRRARSVYFGPEYGRLETAVVDRADITETGLEGPLIVEEYDSTTVVPPGCRIRQDAWQVLRVDVGAA